MRNWRQLARSTLIVDCLDDKKALHQLVKGFCMFYKSYYANLLTYCANFDFRLAALFL